jgi:predicted DNA-binding transcriptional regulator AlpA
VESFDTSLREADFAHPFETNCLADTSDDKPKSRRVPHPNPLTYRPQDLADRLGVTRRYLYELLKHPDPLHRLPAPFKIGRATFWRVEDVQDWLDRQAGKAAA